MQKKKSPVTGNGCYENYPFRTVIIASLVSIATYGIGSWLMFQAGILWLVLYGIFLVFQQVTLIRRSCADCWYYGKVCAFGMGKLACLLAKRGNSEDFGKRKVTWKAFVPDILVVVLPLIAAVVLMILDFSWLLLVPVLVLLVLASAGNGFVRGTLACAYCRQRILGCPAEKLFSKEKVEKQSL